MRKIPRSFKMPFGSGMIVEEASITSKYHEPTIQLLKFDNGDKVIRFCSYNKGKFSRSPLMIDEKDRDSTLCFLGEGVSDFADFLVEGDREKFF